MYKIPILVMKGFIIGIAKIIPGVSGSLVAFNLGLYERGIEAISNFFKNTKSNMIFLLNVGIGIIFSIIIGSKIIDCLLLKFYFPTMLLFIGLLIGTIPDLFKKANIKTKNEWFYFIIIFILMIIFTTLKENNNYIYIDNLKNNLYVILIGFIDALTMIIPGISGTATFMIIGCYEFFLSIFANLTNINNIVENIKIIILFSVGLFLGIIIITKLMSYLLNNKKDIIYPIITSFSVSSIVFLMLQVLNTKIKLIELLIGIILFILGIKISKRLD